MKRLARSRRERGAAALEFALVAIPLLTLLYGIIQYGLLLSFRQNLSQAAAEGARAAAVAAPTASSPYDPASQAKSAIQNALGDGYSCAGGALNKNGTTVGTCTITPSSACAATATSGTCSYTVALTYNYSKYPVIPQVLVPVPSTLSYQSAAQGNTVAGAS